MYTPAADLDEASFDRLNAASQTLCAMMAEMKKKTCFVWKKTEKICLISDQVPGQVEVSLITEISPLI